MDGAGPFQSPGPLHPSKTTADPSPKALSNPNGSSAPRFPDGYILNEIWILKRRIGQGRYSDVYAAVSKTDTGEHRRKVAIKVEKEEVPSEGRLLEWEATVLSEIQECPFVCRMHESGALDDGGFYIVMDLCSETLSECRKRQPGSQFRPHKGAAAAISMLNCIEALHRCGFVHRDIKPSNFVRPLRDSKNVPKSIMIDFGLARRHHQNGVVLAARPTAEFRGTSKYASLNSHFCKELGPRDDMFSFLFVLLDFVLGKLPWSGCSSRNAIASLKRKLFGRDFIRNDSIPAPIYEIAQHLNTLRFQDNPDYNLVRNLVQDLGCRRPSLPLTPSRPHSPIRIIPEISEDSSPMKRLVRPFCESCLTQLLCEDPDCPLLHPLSRKAFVLPDTQPLPLCLDFIRGSCRAVFCERHHWTETEESVYLRTGYLPARSSSGAHLPALSLPTSSSLEAITNALTLSPVHEDHPESSTLDVMTKDPDSNADTHGMDEHDDAFGQKASSDHDIAEEPILSSIEGSGLSKGEVDDQSSTGSKETSNTEFDSSNDCRSQSSLENDKLTKNFANSALTEDVSATSINAPNVPCSLAKQDKLNDAYVFLTEASKSCSDAALIDNFQFFINLDEIVCFEKFLLKDKDFRPLMELNDSFVSFEHVLWSAGYLQEKHFTSYRRSKSFSQPRSRTARSTPRSVKHSSAVESSDSEVDENSVAAPRSRRRCSLEKPIIIRLKLARKYRNPQNDSDSIKAADSPCHTDWPASHILPMSSYDSPCQLQPDSAELLQVTQIICKENSDIAKPYLVAEAEDRGITETEHPSSEHTDHEFSEHSLLETEKQDAVPGRLNSEIPRVQNLSPPRLDHPEPEHQITTLCSVEPVTLEVSEGIPSAGFKGEYQDAQKNLCSEAAPSKSVLQLPAQEPSESKSTQADSQISNNLEPLKPESLQSKHMESETSSSYDTYGLQTESMRMDVQETGLPPSVQSEHSASEVSQEHLQSDASDAFSTSDNVEATKEDELSDSAALLHSRDISNSQEHSPRIARSELLQPGSSVPGLEFCESESMRLDIQETDLPPSVQTEHSASEVSQEHLQPDAFSTSYNVDPTSKEDECSDSSALLYSKDISNPQEHSPRISRSEFLQSGSSVPGLEVCSYCSPRILIRIKRNSRKRHEIQNTLVTLRLKRSLLRLPNRTRLSAEVDGINCVPSFSTEDFASLLFEYLNQTKGTTPGLVIPDPSLIDPNVEYGETRKTRSSSAQKSQTFDSCSATLSEDSSCSRNSDRRSRDGGRREGQPRQSSATDSRPANGVVFNTGSVVSVLGANMNLVSDPVLIRIKRCLITDLSARKRSRIS